MNAQFYHGPARASGDARGRGSSVLQGRGPVGRATLLGRLGRLGRLGLTFILLVASSSACTEPGRRWFSGSCSSSGTCDTGGPCIEGTCGRSCASSAECGDGVCVAHLCYPTSFVCQTAYCDDGNDCSMDLCNTLTAECRHELLASACSDGDLCTVGDECVDEGGLFACKSALKCDDGDPSTVETCDPASGVCSAKAP